MKPLIIPIFLPHLGCRERCIFCNQRVVSPEVPSPDQVRESILSALSHFPPDRGQERQVAFYGGSFTAIPKEDQCAYLKEAYSFLSSGRIDSIRVSTRPDALDDEIFSLLREYGVKTVEVGAQSMDDEVLSLSCRGHSSKDTVSAVSQLKQRGFEVGVHLMIGLPGDSLDRFQQGLTQVIDLRPDFIRIHPVLVLKGSFLEALWRDSSYAPLTLEETVRWLKIGLLRLEGEPVQVARIGLQVTREIERSILAGPFHPALHQLVDSEIYFAMASRLLGVHRNEKEPCLICHPGEVSSVRGQRNENIRRLKRDFEVKSILVSERQDIPKKSLSMQTLTGEVSIQRRDLTEKNSVGRLKPPLPVPLIGRLKPSLPMLFFVFLLLSLLMTASCLPKRQVIYDKRTLPPERREASKEVVRGKKTVVPEKEPEKRETRGVQYGIASWYGPDFHGKPTSSGDVYDMYQLTCAHNSLALGTAVIVTNLENGKSLELKVNDRGPFVKERIIDLSYGAAKILGIWERGTAFVKVETVGPWIEEVPRITLQIGSFTDEVRAKGLAEQLSRRFENVYVTPVETSVQTYYRVRIGPFDTRDLALVRAEQLTQMGFQVLVTSR